MALTSVIQGELEAGGRKRVWGKWTSNSTTGGDIITGLKIVENIVLTPQKATTGTTNAFAVNETFPLNNVNGAVTIVTDSGISGYWDAIGQ